MVKIVHGPGRIYYERKQMDLTPTECRILEKLSDGMPHSKEELVLCLFDDLSSVHTVKYHISNLRVKLRPIGQEIVCEYNRGFKYRRVRLYSTGE